MTSYSNAPALQFRVHWGFFRSAFVWQVLFFSLHLNFFFSPLTLALDTACRCVSPPVWLSICLSHSRSLSLSLFSSSSGLAQAFSRLGSRVSAHVSGAERRQSYTALWRPAGGLSYSGKFAAHAAGMPVCLWLGFSCRLLYKYTHMHLLLSLSFTHTLTWTICSASPVTGPQYRSIIYLRPLTLRIRSRFSPHNG